MFEVLGGLFFLRRSCRPKIRGGVHESTERPQAQCGARISFQHLKVAVDARTRHLASVRAPNPGAIDKALVVTTNHVRIRQPDQPVHEPQGVDKQMQIQNREEITRQHAGGNLAPVAINQVENILGHIACLVGQLRFSLDCQCLDGYARGRQLISEAYRQEGFEIDLRFAIVVSIELRTIAEYKAAAEC